MNLETVAKLARAETPEIAPALLATEVSGFSIDSRSVAAGEVFFALAQPDYQNNGFNGDFSDAHEFIPQAFAQGAIAAVVHRDKFNRAELQSFRDRLLTVTDSIVALQNLAAGVHQNWNKPVVAVTGSAGKTTARELIAAVLREKNLRVLSNVKNYNNGLGHPLTVLRIVTQGEFDAAVLEMGMSTPMNEIQRLCRITPPDVAVELNVYGVHLEHLGTIEAIAAAKAELVENMKPDGVAVLNADDARVLAMREKAAGSRVVTFGIENRADVWASDIKIVRFGEIDFTVNTPQDSAPVRLQLVGRHNVLNALAAAAVGFCFDMPAREIAAGLERVAPPAMRGEVWRFADGFEVINDAYNSNPDALVSMVETLVDNGAHAKRKIVVAGEMLELGDDAANIHFETGKQIARSGVDAVFGVRGLAQNLIEGAAAETPGVETKFFENSDAAAEAVAREIRAGDLVLIKGSRGVRCERIVERLAEKFERV